ncbi:MAG: EamA family transporter [Alphaproteobacteria bacterium]|nr:EamA family transporter [Alphaproteobacteria bacterium]MBU0793271.1 EamA family transporter [Alphaproteobacteria bacterium]MBU0876236.1 EamA family transporter [Alphaproteobacteria bacterium]MBU1768161.1 EamA family transporter [Alphaproteobacteria bacterium]
MTTVHGTTERVIIVTGVLAALAAMISTTVGASFAKTLFPLVGAFGIAALRLNFAAALLLGYRRPWRRPVPRELRLGLLCYGIMLGLMNLLIYEAFLRIPIGIAIAIEVTGPLAVALLGSRRLRDFVWLAVTVVGLLLLVPQKGADALDPVGVAFALASGLCWAIYILAGKHVSLVLGGDAVAWGMLVAAVIAMPLGIMHAGAALLEPWILGVGLVIALLSSALPGLLEMAAMRRLPASVFGLLASATPAVAAFSAYVILGELLAPVQWIAILCIVLASAGSTLSARR